MGERLNQPLFLHVLALPSLLHKRITLTHTHTHTHTHIYDIAHTHTHTHTHMTLYTHTHIHTHIHTHTHTSMYTHTYTDRVPTIIVLHTYTHKWKIPYSRVNEFRCPFTTSFLCVLPSHSFMLLHNYCSFDGILKRRAGVEVNHVTHICTRDTMAAKMGNHTCYQHLRDAQWFL